MTNKFSIGNVKFNNHKNVVINRLENDQFNENLIGYYLF